MADTINKFRVLLKQIMLTRSERGPYRFLIRKWNAIDDIDLAVRVLGSGFFRNVLQPVPLPIKEIKSFLVIAPHQDDEAIGAGGTLLLAAKAGAKIDILFFTNGAQDNAGISAEDTIHIRDREAESVCQTLRATMHRLDVHNLQPTITVSHVQKLQTLILDSQPQVILLPWILDTPAKHRMVNHVLWLVFQELSFRCEVWGYQVHNMLYPNGYVEITDVAQDKRDLIRLHKSQIRYYQPYDHIALGIAAWNSKYLPQTIGEAPTRYAEIFFTLPLKEYLRMIKRHYFKDLYETYNGDQQIISSIASIHREITGQKLVR